MRQTAVFMHRYVGLVMAGFLLLTGVTGAILAWYHELDAALNAEMMRVAIPETVTPLHPLVLREQVQAAYPDAWVNSVRLHNAPDHAVSFWLQGGIDPETQQRIELSNNEIFVSPYTGEILGERMWGDVSQGWVNLMPFIYKLHYTLALGTWGAFVLGIVALLWTIDCFVGIYLTFPASRSKQRSWWQRWGKAWKVRWQEGAFKVNYDLHRAGSLWIWVMLLILAWSSVAFNLPSVYQPVMQTFFSMHKPADEPKLANPQIEPAMGWQQGLLTARQHMAAFAEQKQFTVQYEFQLRYDPNTGLFLYRVRSDRDISSRWGSTNVKFDASSGELHSTYLPTGEASGDTITTWIMVLHLAAIWGIPFKIFMTLVGLLVAVISVTGVYIWWRKRRGRVKKTKKLGGEIAHEIHLSSS